MDRRVTVATLTEAKACPHRLTIFAAEWHDGVLVTHRCNAQENSTWTLITKGENPHDAT